MKRLFVLTVVAACATVFPAPAAASMQRRGAGPPMPRPFVAGQVVSLDGQAADPQGFVLQTRMRTLDIRIGPRTRFTARSAEALVDGFIAGDFALIAVQRMPGHPPLAVRVVYDVVPFGPITQFTVTGTLTRLAPDGHAFLMHLATGADHWITLTERTQYSVGGNPVAALPTTRGESLTVTIRRVDTRWLALAVDVKAAVSSQAHGTAD